uniref:Myeloid-derived growth factor n=1 Tax=Leptobrachium leishanense TaxID=445787 RepID=A0A8C5LPZ2_9ANUR
MAASWLFAAFFILAGVYAQDEAKTEEFVVEPGGLEHSYSIKLGDFSCTFTYVAQGGTNEKWKISVGLSEDGLIFSCSIGRPQGTSYLFFIQFRASVTGAKIEYCEAYSQASADGRKDVPLKKSEYDVSDTAVSHHPGSFASTLARVVIVAQSTHHEL